jgi:2-amino-4-hydroxy-6-hydroxymethyldihydropteridine diphosphokinase
MKQTAYILLGSNQGDRHHYLAEARAQISRRIAPIDQTSSIYLTEAWGNVEQPSFLNQLITLSTEMDPHKLLQSLLAVEMAMGRKRLVKWGQRNIDIDILFYGVYIIEDPQLTIPHPEIPNRRFTLGPLAELFPHLMHPVLKRSVRELLEACSDPLQVKREQKRSE